MDGLAFEHCPLGGTPAHQAGQRTARPIDPARELRRRFPWTQSRVQHLEERGLREGANAAVEGEAHQRVELVLRERNPDKGGHRLLGRTEILTQPSQRLVPGAGIAGSDAVCVPVADGPGLAARRRVGISAEHAALELLDQRNAGIAGLHLPFSFSARSGACECAESASIPGAYECAEACIACSKAPLGPSLPMSLSSAWFLRSAARRAASSSALLVSKQVCGARPERSRRVTA